MVGISDLLFLLYKVHNGRFRRTIRSLVMRLEGGEMYSQTLRRIFRVYHQVDIGLYTHGGCLQPGMVSPLTTIGRYCSIASGVRILNRDHPVDFKSTHALFFNPQLGFCKEELVPYMPKVIGSDVWIWAGAVILPSATNIGHGAVIAANALVNKDVPPYAVVVGNPARVVRFRFSQEVIDHLLESKWWERDIDQLLQDIEDYQQPVEPLFRERAGRARADTDNDSWLAGQ
jgi:acetyltransferase-like isoleucine patch superfamily enzyme